MRGDKYLKKARELERDVRILKKNTDKSKNFEEKLFGKLFSAGKNYELGQDLHHAEALYREAERYVSYVGKNSKEALAKRIRGLGRQRENIHNVLSGDAPLFQRRFKRSFVFVILSIVSFLSALFFLSVNFTGAVVGSTQYDFSILGILFFVLGLVFIFVYARHNR